METEKALTWGGNGELEEPSSSSASEHLMWHYHDEAGHYNLVTGLRRGSGNSIKASGTSLVIMSATPICQRGCFPTSKYQQIPSSQSLNSTSPYTYHPFRSVTSTMILRSQCVGGIESLAYISNKQTK